MVSVIFEKKLFEKKILQFGNFFLAQKLSFLVRINILKFENRCSRNERILLAPFIFSLLAVVLRRYSSRSFADWPTGGYLLPKSSRATSSMHIHYIVVHKMSYCSANGGFQSSSPPGMQFDAIIIMCLSLELPSLGFSPAHC